MKLGSMVMILRPRFRVLNGNHPVLLCEKRTSIKIQHQGDDVCVFDLDGIVRAEFVHRKTRWSLNITRIREWPEKWANGFILHHDNAPCHTSLLVRQFMSNKNITVCPHPPYSPDLALYDFWLFPTVKMTVKGKCFESIQDIEAATTAQLKTLMKEDFQNCFRRWQERWDKCVRSEGD